MLFLDHKHVHDSDTAQHLWDLHSLPDFLESLAPVVASELSGWLIIGVASQLAHPRSCQCALGQREFQVWRHRVSACVRLLQLRQDVLVVLAVDVDLVAIILLNGKRLALRP